MIATVRHGQRSLFQLRETFQTAWPLASITSLASRLRLPLSILNIIAGVTIFVVGGFIPSSILFKLILRDERPLTIIRGTPAFGQ